MTADIAVVMSTYNGARFLDAQLASIRSQAGVTLRLLVRDDGSTDATIAILRRHQAEDPRIEICEGSNLGVTASFLAGLAAARGAARHFAFADQDDVWHQGKLAALVAALDTVAPETPALAFTQVRLVDAAGAPLPAAAPRAVGPGFPAIVAGNEVAGCTMAFNARLADLALDRLPDLDRLVMHDWWLIIIASALGRVIAVDRALVDYRQHGGNVIGGRTGFAALAARARRVLTTPGTPLVVQARAFLGQFGDLLSPPQRAQLSGWIAATAAPLGRRLAYVLAPGVRRRRPADDLVFRALLVAGRYRSRSPR